MIRIRSNHLHSKWCLSQAGFTIAELLACMAIFALLAAIVVPAIQYTREQSRVLACKDRLRQFGIAAHSHESFHRAFPYTAVNSTDYVNGVLQRLDSVSPHRELMYSLDPVVATQIDAADHTIDFVYSSQPTNCLSAENRRLGELILPVLLCPSDRRIPGATNYRANIGISPGIFDYDGSPYRERTARRGAFVNGQSVRPDQFDDGLSNTAMFAERVTGSTDPFGYDIWRDRYAAPTSIFTADAAIQTCQSFATQSPSVTDPFSGSNWLLGGWRQTWYDHIDTPNSPTPDCASGPSFNVSGAAGMMTARSLHSGGVNVCFADGSVKMLSGSIDLDLWRGLGTRNGAEPIENAY